MPQTTEVRKSKNKKPEERKTGLKIQVEDLRVGDRIVDSWHRRAERQENDDEFDSEVAQLHQQLAKGNLTYTEVQEALIDIQLARGEKQDNARIVNRSHKVEKIVMCEGHWRTHILVNKKDCYDTRQFIWIVDERS